MMRDLQVVRGVVRYGYAPFMMLGLTTAAYLVVSNEHSYFWLAPLLAVAYATAFGAEHIAPFFDEWNVHAEHGDTEVNLAHTLMYEFASISGVLTIPLIVWLFPVQGLWPTHWPMWGQLLIALVVSDFAFSMMHYLSHRWSPLWRLHAVHHGVGRLYGLNGVIRHPLHQSIDMIVGNLPLVLMGMPVPVAILLGFCISITLIVQHSNVDARLGPLEGHLSIGRIHHMHHVNWGTEGDCNFSLLLTIWDRMLGTFQDKPSRPITAKDMGIDELPNFPKSYIEQLMLPIYYKPGQGEPERYWRGTTTPAQDAKAQIMRGEAAG